MSQDVLLSNPSQQFEFEGCYASLTSGEFIAGNAWIERRRRPGADEVLALQRDGELSGEQAPAAAGERHECHRQRERQVLLVPLRAARRRG